MRIVPFGVIWTVPLLLTTGCDQTPTATVDDVARAVAPSPQPAPDVAARAQLVATIHDLSVIAGNPMLRARSTFGTTSNPTASVDEILADLKGVLKSLDANQGWIPRVAPAPSGTGYADYASPRASGASYISVSGAPGTFRDVHYRTYTACIDCNPYDYPKGLMRVRQYAGSVPTLSIDRTFSGGQGYSTGEIINTLTGSVQTGTISTDHWIDVWLGNDPHYYSSATAEV